MDLQILPLAVTMMMGPQMMSAVILVTTERAVRASLAFLLGVAVATTVGIAITRGIFALIGDTVMPSGYRSGTPATLIQVGLVALLLAAAVKNYVRRETIEPPKWLTTLMAADPWKALMTGILVILLMPSDIIVMLTVGANLQRNDAGLIAALPFVAATVLIAALPLLVLLLFRRRAACAMPQVREWMNSHSWMIKIVTCLIFITLIL